jgi:hypothetical protein
MDASTSSLHIIVGVKAKGAPVVYAGDATTATEKFKEKLLAKQVVKGKMDEADKETDNPLYTSVIWYGKGRLIDSRKTS